mmetsp:Transcript_19716/g.47854  ORF Transcript_19716/g.47854 Transcript_19716/m.47854 type:complete len:129 (+) Transcript_19716:45-431(+)
MGRSSRSRSRSHRRRSPSHGRRGGRSDSRGRGRGGDSGRECTGDIVRKNDKGFGFIRPDGGDGQDLYFHCSECATPKFDDLRSGDRVSFKTGTCDRTGKPMAKNVYGLSGGSGGGGGRSRRRDDSRRR